MRITIGSGNRAQTVVVPQGKEFRRQDYHERQRFERDFCKLANIDRTATIHQVARRQQYVRENPNAVLAG